MSENKEVFGDNGSTNADHTNAGWFENIPWYCRMAIKEGRWAVVVLLIGMFFAYPYAQEKIKESAEASAARTEIDKKESAAKIEMYKSVAESAPATRDAVNETRKYVGELQTAVKSFADFQRQVIDEQRRTTGAVMDVRESVESAHKASSKERTEWWGPAKRSLDALMEYASTVGADHKTQIKLSQDILGAVKPETKKSGG